MSTDSSLVLNYTPQTVKLFWLADRKGKILVFALFSRVVFQQRAARSSTTGDEHRGNVCLQLSVL